MGFRRACQRAKACGFACLALLVSGAVCAAPPEFPDWTIPVPENTPIVQHAHVPIGARSEHIELVEDLVLGGATDDPQQAFFGLGGVAVGAGGRVYVLDRGNERVQVFDRDGTHRMSIGRRGQGPGELMVPRTLAVAGDLLAVTDVVSNRWQTWDASGALIAAVDLFERNLDVDALDNGSFVGSYYDDVESPRHMSIVLMSAEGDIVDRYMDWEPRATRAPWELRARPGVAVDPTGVIYVYGGDRYQVLAVAASNDPLWALRTDWPTPPVAEETIEGILDVWRGFDPPPSAGLKRSEWPEIIPTPAIMDVKVDGHGHVYVFPHIYVNSQSPPPEDYPVDVYGPDGAALFAGHIAINPIWWWASSGDDVYVHALDQGSGEEELIRYRLVEPFDSQEAR